MSIRRVTISIDENLIKEIKTIQASMIANTERSVSFSAVLSQLVKQSLKELNYNQQSNSWISR
jgi:metal-responsive CopG/Arc/MetJ family transcriptional regulator